MIKKTKYFFTLGRSAVQLILIDYFINLSVFSLLVCTPLVILSMRSKKMMRYSTIFGGIYAGIVSVILMLFTIRQQGYAYDIRYVPLILSFVYLGPLAGFITGSFVLISRLFAGGNWLPVVVGWGAIMASFSIISPFLRQHQPIIRVTFYYFTYSLVYIILIPFLFSVIDDNLLFHLEYLLFILAGLVLGYLLIESHQKLYSLNINLEKSEAKYRLIAENTTDLIKVMDSRLRITYFSPSHQLVLGYDPDDADAVEANKWFDENEIKTMLASHKPESIEHRWKRADGQWMEIESRFMPVFGDDGSLEHIVIISRDISERKQTEELLRRSEKLSVVGKLAAGVAHEIRNPLTTLKGFIQLQKKENPQSFHLDLLIGELERIESITNELLSLAKPQAIQMKQAMIQDLVQNVIDILTPQAVMSNIQIVMNADSVPLLIQCEPNQMKQAFVNLLKNAMEAMPAGGNIHVGVTRADEEKAVISIQDQGSGIPEELLPRLGEPFYTLKEKGTGLGLMICNKIVKEHRGSISFQSKLNQGTLVLVKLPLSMHKVS